MLADLPTTPWFRHGIIAAVLLGILLLTYMVLQPFLVPSIWAAILAYVCWPLHIRVSRVIRRRKNLAALVTTLMISAVIIVPICWLVFSFQGEVMKGYQEVEHRLAAKPELSATLRDLPMVGSWLTERWAELTADPTALKTSVQRWLNSSANELTGVIGGVGRNLIKLLIALFALFFFLRDGARFFSQFRAVMESMLGPTVRNYLKAVGDTTRAVVYALVLAALAQGVAAGIGYYFAGIRAPILLGALTAMVALIPLATPLVWISLSVWLVVTGHLSEGIGLAIWGVLVISWVDNIVRPLVISSATRMPFILVVFGVLGGVLAFGLVGLFIGPVVLAVSLAMWREWLEHRQLGTPLSSP
ncbi:MAG: AI-2E family transporter [Steroidobacteraceae bacterium]